jgi:hypothetical protein
MATRPLVRVALFLLLVSAAAAAAASRQAAQPAAAAPGPGTAKPAAAAQAPQPAKPAEPKFDEAKAVADLRKEIAGREKEPADKVYMAVEVMQGFTAGQLLAVMQEGYSRPLGVTCTHCHIPGQWQADDKKPKEIARGMIQMNAKINNELLPKIKALERPYRPVINCTTCHRGQLKPAIQLP